MTAVVVMAKAPVAGRVKTRLCPPCTSAEAALLADAALRDTLDAVRATPAVRPVLALDGRPGAWVGEGVQVIGQGTGTLDRRIAAVLLRIAGPVLVIGMDTPHVGPDLLAEAVDRLGRPGVDAVLGPAVDGGWWALGLREPRASDVLGVPMSTPETGVAQRRCLVAGGRRVDDLVLVQDVDDIVDARAVAAAAPHTRFARVLARLGLDGIEPAPARAPASR